MSRSEDTKITQQDDSSDAPRPDNPGKLIVYFDGSCPLCTAEIDHYAGQAGADRLNFVDVSGEAANPGADLTPRDAMRRFHVRKPDGTLLSGARAFAAIWSVLPAWRWAARIAGLPGMPTALEILYRAFLPVRPLLSKLATWFGARPVNTCPARK